MSGTAYGGSSSSGSPQNKLWYTDFRGKTHHFTPKKDEIMLGYKSTGETKGFLDALSPSPDRVPEEDSEDTEYSYARVTLAKPNSIDNMSFLMPKQTDYKYIPIMKESGRDRSFFPVTIILRIKKTNTKVIEEAEITGTVLGYKIIRKYPFKSNQLGEQEGDDEDSPLVHKSDIINNNYGYYVVRVPESPSGEKTEETLFRTLRELNSPNKPADVEYAEVDEVKFHALLYTPVDPEYLGSQWGLKTGAGTRTNLAWDVTNNRGHQNVVIAVLDTGLRTTHQDFIFRSGSTPATLVINSYNVLDGSTNVSHTGTDPNRFHGTWVAGVSSARVDNNDSGIAGAAFQCRITPVKICTASTIVTSNAEAGINYIIGKTGEFPSRRYIILAGWTVDDTASFQSTVEDAYNNHNILIVAAAGDNNQDINSNPKYPASYSVTLPVGAHDSSAIRFPTSSFGSNVVMAPGVSIRTTNGSGNTAVTDRDGSSLAAAFVAGEAATVWGRDRNVNGSFTRTNAQVKAIMIDPTNLDSAVGGVPNLGRIRTDLAANF